MLRKLVSFFFLPPVLIGFLSLAPFAINWSDYLSAKALYATRRIGFDPSAFGYACLCVGAFSLLYFFASFRSRQGERQQVVLRHPRHTKRLVLVMVGILAVVGLGVTVFTVTTGGSGYTKEMARRLIEGELATDVLYNSQGYMFSESVSGLIRMLGGWSTAAVLMWLSLAAQPWRGLIKKMYWPGLALLLAVNFVRGVLGGDRGPALVVFLLTAYVALTQIRKEHLKPMRKGRSLQTRGMVLGLVIIFGMGLWAYTRLDKLRNPGDYNTILFYSDMGVGNLSLAMKTGQGMGYGYYTFAGPISVVFRYLGITIAWPQFTADTIEEGRFMNLLGYTYADFGLFGFVIYGLLGLLSGWVHRNIRVHSSRLVWRVMHLYILWALSSAFTVPIFTGMSYWAGLFGAIAVSFFLDTRRKIYAIPAAVFLRKEKVST